MLTQNEINALSLSPTKKDFAQIWNELLEISGKLAERWDPTSTNESDPGIVILKVLAGIADKLNYNIDKNILEAFMPTAAQEDSMRKLCEMLGYNIKYYQSAKTKVTIKYYNPDAGTDEITALSEGLTIPKFTVITNNDQDINYFIINDPTYRAPALITNKDSSITFVCLEGQLVKCESLNDNNVITANQISENNRFYLPETQIAENGIFVYNVINLLNSDTLEDGVEWTKVDNLNVQPRGSRVYKFGFDSYESRPYLEFPEDYSELFNEGLFIYYTRTSGASGNISAGTLTKLELPSISGWDQVSAESFSVENAVAATTGSNIETIKQAYSNFKKTVGTFETLVTCRDYMNKIYSMVDGVGKPCVSNILVTDIRNDLNRAVTICSCNDSGIFYKETPLIVSKHQVGAIKTETGERRLTGETDYSLVGKEEDEVTSDPVIVDDVTSDNPEEISNDTNTSYIISEANKPIFGNPIEVQYGDSVDTTTIRSTNWHLGTVDGLPIFADKYGDSFIKVDYTAFKSNETGEVLSTDSSGKDSDVWCIKQGNTYFKTTLPITNVPSTETIVVQEKTRTVTKQVTKEKQRTLKERRTQIYEVDKTTIKEINTEYAIDHFDLVLYPFKSYSQIRSNVRDIRKVYDASFTYSPSTFNELERRLHAENLNTIAHNITAPRRGDVVCINNYLRLNATIATNSKITSEEGSILIDKIKIALANAFNMRELDFGEEIPFDSIVEVIENADPIIRVASLNDPTLYTTFSVFEGYDTISGAPTINEYAVKSKYLSDELAQNTGSLDTSVDANGEYIGTFNSDKARSIYNKLAVRNVLAGRVPLFNYNTTFETNFNETAYQVTEETDEIPSTILEKLTPTAENPFTVWVKDGITYTGHFIAPQKVGEEGSVIYKKTYIPDGFLDDDTQQQHGVKLSNISTVGNNAITEIKTNCIIKAETPPKVTDVTLDKGEIIKFRAPNFITKETYPAYVNYHLALNKEYRESAINAEASSIFDILNADRNSWSLENPGIKWQSVLDYFESVDNGEYGTPRTGENKLKKVAPRSQKISKYVPASSTGEDTCTSEENEASSHVRGADGKCKYCGVQMLDPVQKGPIVVKINDTPEDEIDLEDLLNKSGCVRPTKEHDIFFNEETGKYEVKAILTWNTSDGDPQPAGTGPDLDIRVALDNPFITDSATLVSIETAIQTRLDELVNQVQADGVTPILPTNCAWNIMFEYECVPFTPASYNEWLKFLRLNDNEAFIGFKTDHDGGDLTAYRAFGEGYNPGKYILQDTRKLIALENNYFALLPTVPLKGAYILKTVGKDSEPVIFYNNTEYMLGLDEYLYIEYTPASTSEDGTSQDLPPVTKVHGEGTIIRPGGFDQGLMDSSVYKSLGNSPHKTVSFEGIPDKIEMQRFGPNEQVEIRDFARVTLRRDTFKNADPGIYLYKNFNNCDELEKLTGNKDGKRTYMLKDGEYILYTDKNQSEFAYFASGTQVTLEGKVVLEQFEAIDLNTVFDEGPSVIPWGRYQNFANDDDKIIFQEYQYITLGEGDKLTKATLLEREAYISAEWQYCSDVEYITAGDTNATPLEAIKVTDPLSRLHGTEKAKSSNGWEVCSMLELDVSRSSSQTLRNTGIVETSLALTSTSPSGDDDIPKTLTITPNSEYGAPKISFKTNLPCQSSSSTLKLNDVLNPDKLKGFEFKLYASDEPVIVDTLAGKVLPYHAADEPAITDLTQWTGQPVMAKNAANLWNAVSLKDIRATSRPSPETHDSALRLPINILPNTYGVFSIYLNYTLDEAEPGASPEKETWIEVLPGTQQKDITLLNVPENEIIWQEPVRTGDPGKLMLNPGINCIRVNKTGRIFVKTSEDSLGTLFFDNLKLVNCEYLEYAAANETEPTTTMTQGLNIDQLGYLNLEDSTILDVAARDKFKESYFEKAFTALASLEDELADQASPLYKKLYDAKDQLKALTAFIENAHAELETLFNTEDTNKEAITGLFIEYASLNSELIKELQLVQALDANKAVSDIEQQLAELLVSFSSIETVQQQLLADLEALVAKASKQISELSEKEVLNNFESTVDDLNETERDAIKKASMELVEANYSEQLSSILTSIDEVVNSEERANLLSILDNLKALNSVNKKAEILTTIKQLVSDANNSEIESTLDTILAKALDFDYRGLVLLLYRFREYLNTKNLTSVLEELATVSDETDTQQLAALLDKLSGLLNETSEYTESINDIISLAERDINTAEDIPAEDTPTEDTPTEDTSAKENKEITAKVTSLYNAISGGYKVQLENLVYSIDTLLRLLNTDNTAYDEAINSLQESKNAQVEKILNAFNDVTEERNDYIEVIETTFNPETNTDFTQLTVYEGLPFGKKAIYKVWAKTLKTQLNADLEEYFEYAFKAISTFDTDSLRSLPQTLGDFIEESFKERITQLLNRHNQNIARETLIKDIRDKLPSSSSLQDALEEITNIGSSRLAIIANLINSLTNAETAIERQSAIKDLRAELTSNIKIDQQLAALTAELICPCILLFEQKLPAANVKDDAGQFTGFYAKLAEAVTEVRTSVLNHLTSDPEVTFQSICINDELVAFVDQIDSIASAELSELLNKDSLTIVELADLLIAEEAIKNYLPDDLSTALTSLSTINTDQSSIKDTKDHINSHKDAALVDVCNRLAEYTPAYDSARTILDALKDSLDTLTTTATVPDEYAETLRIVTAETQLLKAIQEIDVDRDFYYTAPTNTNLAIEFNPNDSDLNTLMNPLFNYDINNVNNNFVISKLDIDYIDKGLKIARSSLLN